MSDNPSDPKNVSKKLIDLVPKYFPAAALVSALAQIDSQLQQMAESLLRVIPSLRAEGNQETRKDDFAIGKPLDGDAALPAGLVTLAHIQALKGYRLLQAACAAQKLNVKLEVMVQDSTAPGYTKGFPLLPFKALQQRDKNFLIGLVRIYPNKPYSESQLIVNFSAVPPTPPQGPAPKP